MAPSVALSRWRLGGTQRRLTEGEFDFAAAVACATAAAVGTLGLWGARLLLTRRTGRLSTYLTDTTNG